MTRRGAAVPVTPCCHRAPEDARQQLPPHSTPGAGLGKVPEPDGTTAASHTESPLTSTSFILKMGHFWGTVLPAGRISSTDSIYAAGDPARQPGSHRDHRHGSPSGVLLKHVLLRRKLRGCWHKVVKSHNLNIKHSKHRQ